MEVFLNKQSKSGEVYDAEFWGLKKMTGITSQKHRDRK